MFSPSCLRIEWDQKVYFPDGHDSLNSQGEFSCWDLRNRLVMILRESVVVDEFVVKAEEVDEGKNIITSEIQLFVSNDKSKWRFQYKVNEEWKEGRCALICN